MRAVNSHPTPLGDRLPILVARQCLALWSWWTLANMVGGTLSLLLSQIPAEVVGEPGLLFGFLPLYVVQWLVLRRYLRAVGRSALAALKHKCGWVVASMVGVLVGWHLQSIAAVGLRTAAIVPHQDLQALGVLVDAEVFWARAVCLFVLGGVVGAAQWLVLRRHTDWAGFWIPASALAAAASGTVALVIDTAMPIGSSLLAYIAGWSVYGALTGAALVLLLRDRVVHRLERRLEQLRRVTEEQAAS